VRKMFPAASRFALQTMVSGAWRATPDRRTHTQILRTKRGRAAGKARPHEIEVSSTSVYLILKDGTRWRATLLARRDSR
jgi:hypothetical protein